MLNIRELLAERKLLFCDGAWGTQLAERGLPAGEVPERWNLERPDHVRAVAAAYVEAGSDVILTNTFGASRIKLARAGLDERAEEVNRRGAELSREAAGERALVFASVGPSGEFMAPLGAVNEEQMAACFAEQAGALAAGGADAIVIETMTDLAEAKAALRGVREAASLPAVVSMTFERGMKGFATMMGVRPAPAAAELAAAGADAVGTNCGRGIEDAAEIVALMRAETDLPVWAKPNAGLPQLVEGRTVFPATPEQMAGGVPALVGAGARIVGGCCGTTPEHVRAMVALREALIAELA